MGYYDYYNFPRAAPRPKAVEGKARKKFGFSWWGKKWIEAVESEGDEQRMARGRAYARADKVYNINIQTGKVSAKVEGSRGNYTVSIKFAKMNEANKKTLLDAIAKDPILLGSIINNELPDDIESKTNVKIIPRDFESECSCPDYANPCKHIASIFYVLSDEIDKAPQILFKLQGLDANEIIDNITNPSAINPSITAADQKPNKKVKKIKKESSVKLPLISAEASTLSQQQTNIFTENTITENNLPEVQPPEPKSKKAKSKKKQSKTKINKSKNKKLKLNSKTSKNKGKTNKRNKNKK